MALVYAHFMLFKQTIEYYKRNSNPKFVFVNLDAFKSFDLVIGLIYF